MFAVCETKSMNLDVYNFCIGLKSSPSKKRILTVPYQTQIQVFPFGISDHNLVQVTTKLKNKRPPPKCMRTRDYRRLDQDKFRSDIESAPFHIGSIFDDADDRRWVWQKLYIDTCDEHASWKEVKVRNKSAPWIKNNIRYKMIY